MGFWEEDLALGEDLEKTLIPSLEGHLHSKFLHMVHDNSYDLVFENGETVEVKADFMSKRTRNVVIEYKDRDKGDSGLYITKAKWWVHYFYRQHTKEWEARISLAQDLKKFTYTRRPMLKDVSMGDIRHREYDGTLVKQAWGYLIPQEEFVSITSEVK